MSGTNPYKPPVSGGQTPSGASRPPLTAFISIIIFVSCVVGLLSHAASSGSPPGAPTWYGPYHVSYLILQAVCAVGLRFSKPLALVTLAIVVLIDVAVEILVLGEWDPISIGVAAVMIYFLLGYLRSKR